MTGGFVFPPPPPPPPRATSSVPPNSTRNPNAGAGPFSAGAPRGGWRGTNNRTPRGGGNRGTFHNRHQRGGHGADHQFHSNVQDRRHHETSTDQTARASHVGASKRPWSDAFAPQKRQVPKGNAPPAVPSFGFDFLNTQSAASPPSKPIPEAKKRKDQKHNMLGLTPRTDENESSDEEDDTDEEEKLARLLHGNGQGSAFEFEHNGNVMNLSTPAAISEWLAERKKRYPTKKRIAESEEEKRKAKEAAMAYREHLRSTRNHLLPKSVENPSRHVQTAGKSTIKSETETTAPELESMQIKADNLRRQLAELERELGLSKATKITSSASYDEKIVSGENVDHIPTTSVQKGDEGSDLYTAQRTNVAALQMMSEMEPNPQDSAVSDDTSSSSGLEHSEDSDSAPEEQSSKVEVEEVEQTKTSTHFRVCRYFRRDGRCKLGSQCTFRHEVSNQEPDRVRKSAREESKRLTLFERLMERQRQEENEELLRLVIVLGEAGYLDGQKGT